jgi:hypothetical protein
VAFPRRLRAAGQEAHLLVQRQRHKRKMKKLDKEKVALLNDLKFRW